MKTMKKVLSIILVGILVLCLAACGQQKQSETPKENESLNVAVVFSYSGLGDGSFNDSTYKGLERAKEELNVTYTYVEPASQADYEQMILAYAQEKCYDVIICAAYDMGSSLETVAPMFPDQKFIVLDTSCEAPNVAGYEYASAEAAYLAGVAAGLATLDTSLPQINDDNVIGFVGAMDIDLIKEFSGGYTEGAKSVNPDVEVVTAYVGDWGDPAKANELAVSLKEKGADVIYHVASLGGLGVIEAAGESGFLCIGQDDNQNPLNPDYMMMSVLKRLDNTVYNALKDLGNDVFHAGKNILGLADGGVDVTTEGSNITLPDDILKAVEDAR